MNRIITCILIISISLALCACSNINTEKVIQPANFYYPYAEIDLTTKRYAIAPEKRDISGIQSELELLTVYLSGPENTDLSPTFPADFSVVGYRTSGSRVYLDLNSERSMLGGMDLTIACACITLTTLDYCGLKVVELNIKNPDESITTVVMHRDDLILKDLYLDGKYK